MVLCRASQPLHAFATSRNSLPHGAHMAHSATTGPMVCSIVPDAEPSQLRPLDLHPLAAPSKPLRRAPLPNSPHNPTSLWCCRPGGGYCVPGQTRWASDHPACCCLGLPCLLLPPPCLLVPPSSLPAAASLLPACCYLPPPCLLLPRSAASSLACACTRWLFLAAARRGLAAGQLMPS